MWVSEEEIDKLRWEERGGWSGITGEYEDWKGLDVRSWSRQHKGTRVIFSTYFLENGTGLRIKQEWKQKLKLKACHLYNSP